MGCLGRCVTPYSGLAAFAVITQTIFTKRVKRGCMACSIGKFLALLMIYGLTYLMVTHASPIHSIKNGISGEKSILKGGIGFKRLLRKPHRLPPRLSPYEKAFLQAWSGYKMYALGSDELMPLSKRGIDGLGGLGDTVSMLYYDELMSLSKRGIDGLGGLGATVSMLYYDELMSLSKRGIDGLGGLGATVVDALDTTMIMKLDDVVKESGSWIEKNLPGSSSKKGQVNLFETAIRVVGGLLSAYHLSK
ncbi:mannosyl-oligosaccharide 1,2-alpha-mannosidase MNS3 [Tanacetum coccineum]